MGCSCSNTLIENKQSNSIHIIHKSNLIKEQEYLYHDHIKNNVISISQRTFINEKNYCQFKNDYEIIRHLGNGKLNTLNIGSFGSVHQVRHILTGEIRAVKIIDKSKLETKDQNELLREVEVLRSLNHPNIVKLYEFFTDEKNFYLVTEFCNGGELFEKIYEMGNFSEKLAALVMKNILMAVAFCHNEGIVHRDLKPENILLEVGPSRKDILSIKIIDFGTSRPFKKNQKLKDALGTPYYIAPEVIKEKYDEKCDVWSCGVIMYILLTGSPPFNGRTDMEILSNVETGVVDYEVIQFKSISEPAMSLLKQLLTYDPKKRISAQKALEHPWFKKVNTQSQHKNKEISEIMKRLNQFNVDRKLQQAAFHFIVNQLVSKDEVSELRKVFMQLDLNNDGRLSYSELVEGYKKYFGSLQPELDGKIIFEKVDTDRSGYISYEEFICGTVDIKKIVTEEKLKQAFKLFDKNGDGLISAAEIKEVLGRGNFINDEVLHSIIKEVDLNGDGEISLEEFKNMMLKTLN